jgi:hypothetical protein
VAIRNPDASMRDRPGATRDGGATPLSGATVEITPWSSDYSPLTSEQGTYRWWLDQRNSPQSALEGLLGRREEELRQPWAALSSLSERYRAVPRHSGTGELAEIVTGTCPTLRRWRSSLGSARCQVRLLSWPPFETESSGPTPGELEVLRKGIPVRVLYDDSGIRDPASIARCRAGIAAGEQARMAGEVPVPLRNLST